MITMKLDAGSRSAEKSPQNVRCVKCQHVWVAVYLPMDMALFAKVMKAVRCPMCAAGGKAIVLDNTPAGDSARTPIAERWPGLNDWLACGRRGISSNTIVQHLTGINALRDWSPSHPFDPDDMTRCRRLLEAVPSLVPELPRMASLSPEWAALVGRWQEICDLMDEECPEWRNGRGMAKRTYALMKELTDRPRRATPTNDASGEGK